MYANKLYKFTDKKQKFDNFRHNYCCTGHYKYKVVVWQIEEMMYNGSG